jgi:hypothetical protein
MSLHDISVAVLVMSSWLTPPSGWNEVLKEKEKKRESGLRNVYGAEHEEEGEGE